LFVAAVGSGDDILQSGASFNALRAPPRPWFGSPRRRSQAHREKWFGVLL